MNRRILVSCPLITDSIGEFDDLLDEHDVEYDVVEVDQHLSEAELLEIIDQYDGVIAGDDEFTRQVIEAGSRLEVIAKWGVGTDSIDHEAAADHGVTVSNTPGAFADEVADVVIGYAIMLTRELHLIDRSVREGRWDCPRGVSLGGKTMGIVGVGNIGSCVARRAAAHGMSVLGSDVRPIADDLRAETGIEAVETDELFERSDVVSLNCGLTPATRQLVDERRLELLGSDGYLINTSRGEIVDQGALVSALESDGLAGAALDVFEEEPLPVDHPLTDFDNAILGSHNAQNTQEAVDRTNRRAVENVLRGLGIDPE
jgi:D-3-phosphoglycerate dehydrogenase